MIISTDLVVVLVFYKTALVKTMEFSYFPLRSPWEGISFVKSSFSDTVRKILPVLQTMPFSLSLQQVQSLIAKSLQSSLASLSSLQSSLSRIDEILTLKFSPLERLYAAYSRGISQPPAAAFKFRLNNISSRIHSFFVGILPTLGSSPLSPPPSVFPLVFTLSTLYRS